MYIAIEKFFAQKREAIKALPVMGRLVAIMLALTLAGCPSEPDYSSEGGVYCQGIYSLLVDADMMHQPIYVLDGGACKVVKDIEKEKLNASMKFFSDTACKNSVAFEYKSFDRYCQEALSVSELGANPRVGNPSSWRVSELDRAAKGVEKKWTISQFSRLNVFVFDQTKYSRPYEKELEYRNVNGCSLGMKVYKKDVGAKNLKPIMITYGGGWNWRGVAYDYVQGYATLFAEKGYIVFAPAYRLAKESNDSVPQCRNASLEQISSDIVYAKDWILENGKNYGMDPKAKKIALMGASSGGQLSAYVATHYKESVSKAFILYGALDIEGAVLADSPGGVLYARQFQREDLLNALGYPSTLPHLNTVDAKMPAVVKNGFPRIISEKPDNFPPIYLMHGDADSIVPVEASVRVCEAYSRSLPASPVAYVPTGESTHQTCGGKGSELYVVSGAEHIFDFDCWSKKHPLLANIVSLASGCESCSCPAGNYATSLDVADTIEITIKEKF